MSDRVFVDTNILVYAHDLDAGRKHEVAISLLRDLWESQAGVISTQVLQEFYVNVTRKIAKPISPPQARGILSAYAAWQVEIIQPVDVLQASEVQERHQLSFWDAMIIVAAAKGGADVLVTEDLNPGQVIEGVRVSNPFL
jgi:predicted nucleic acid-binding protein